MYTEEELQGAVQEGIFEEHAVERFRGFVQARRTIRTADEENFKLFSGLNDVFVSISALLFLGSAGWLGASIETWIGFAVVAVLSWGLSHYFVLKRRLSLPSLILLGTFVGGVFGGVNSLLANFSHVEFYKVFMFAFFASIPMVWLHWKVFRVPVTVALGVGCVSGFVIFLGMALLKSIDGFNFTWVSVLILLCGFAQFACAMYWDIRDPQRKTKDSDVAFWLHCGASPMIVHPIFSMLGVLESNVTWQAALVAVLLYVVLAVISIAIDRRAMMISALIYVVYSFGSLFAASGMLFSGLAVAGVCIGLMLLFLSAGWASVRKKVIECLPAAIRPYLPSVQ